MNPIVRFIRRAQIRANAPRIAAHPNPYGVRIAADIAYRPDGAPEHRLDVYSPAEGGVLPVILEVHGGGYLACNKEINAQHGQYLASRGFHVVNMNYTLCPEGSPGAILNEMADALDFITGHAGEYGFDPGRVFLTGDSAGGHFVLLAAAMFTSGRAADFFGVRRPGIVPAGFAASCPMGSFRFPLLSRNLSSWMLYLILHKYTFDRAVTWHSSYEYYMDADYPHVWYCTSPTDALLYSHTRRMHEYMQAHGIAHTYREYVGTTKKLDHAFNVLDPDLPECRAANDDMLDFFRERAGQRPD